MGTLIKIDDLIDEFNYERILLYTKDVFEGVLMRFLKRDAVNHLYRLESIYHGYNDEAPNNFFYIENCDLQNPDDEEVAHLITIEHFHIADLVELNGELYYSFR